jgi:predicted LPLAT superfamily acyltransferase
MKLVVVTKTFWSDVGVGNAAREIARELVRLGVELITVIHADAVVTPNEPRANVTPIAIRGRNSLLMCIPLIDSYLLSRRAARIIRSLQKDYGDDYIVHCHNLFPYAFLSTEERRASSVTTIHDTIRGGLERFCKEKPLYAFKLYS